MDPNHRQQSGIPRPSRLPLPRASGITTRQIRPSPSRERLQADAGVNASRLCRPSREKLSTTTPYDYQPTTTLVQPSQNEPKRRMSSDRSNQARKVSSSRVDAKKNAPRMAKPAALTEEGKSASTRDEESLSDATRTPTARRKPRPSLSERTLETLAQIPSPSPARRKSGFVPPQGPMGPPLRPVSALSCSRPSSSHGSTLELRPPSRSASPAKQPPPPVPRIPRNLLAKAPARSTPGLNSRQSVAGHQIATADERPTTEPETVLRGKASGPLFSTSSPIKPVASKSMTLRPKKPRPSIGALRRSSGTIESIKPKDEVLMEESSVTLDKNARKVPRSSLSFRETIAMAKKAARTSNAGVDGASANDSSLSQLPTDSNRGLLRKRVMVARTSGHLNIAAMGLSDIPDEVMNMYEFDPEAAGDWYESVDLIKLIAADNEMESIREDAFHDAAPEDIEELDSKGLQFRGVEIMDLHRNNLRTLPAGLRRLQRLRILNLSNNKLDAVAFPIISQIESLVELRIANNAMGGDLPEEIGHLKNLEVLDIHDNFFEALPESMEELIRLRVLNLAQNKISLIPFDAIAKLPLAEILASKNRLDGTLLPSNVTSLQSLRILDVRNNKLTTLADHDVNMPNLQQLTIDYNRLSSIPDLSSCKGLLTLTAEDNKLLQLPEGFTTLSNLRNADFTGNELTKLDDRIALMDNLTNLQFGSNPLRDRRFLTMSTEELKHDLRGRLDTESRPVHNDSTASSDNSSTSSVADGWFVKPGGILDRSLMQIATLEDRDLQATSSKQDIKSLILHHNLLIQLPSSLQLLATTLTALDLSHNKLSTSSVAISLPYLKSLNLSSNSLTSMSLLEKLSAPLLTHLDVSCNRLTTLPRLRSHFPELINFVANDNAISELDVDAVRGLRALNVSGNDIGHLPPRLGLLGETLRSLEVGGNRFRVPRYTVLEKGTEAVLAWLRDRIPSESVASETDSVD